MGAPILTTKATIGSSGGKFSKEEYSTAKKTQKEKVKNGTDQEKADAKKYVMLEKDGQTYHVARGGREWGKDNKGADVVNNSSGFKNHLKRHQKSYIAGGVGLGLVGAYSGYQMLAGDSKDPASQTQDPTQAQSMQGYA